ncbi:shikimate dehydrogenase family protein [Flavobacterium silvaticum]|uniref:Shikimate dehydrogenase n=1 Tax=Flavobacterium silvaticum TaxID=1852020 RepID=A0A972JHF9_9FLAO|nr:shikimate dehydrogenase [Flavobacterium silvaticum]NMH29201.1 shikimate dehydrogenase [Flavobacterium silvaticum]
MSTEIEKRVYGLIGKNIGYSFSRNYFTDKFESLKLEGFEYRNFDLADLSGLSDVFQTENLRGLNVTIPYKEEIIPKLDSLSQKALAIGAVNTIRILPDGTHKGYNTDWFGFKKALEPLLQPHHQKALILGTGGSSKAVSFALNRLGIAHTIVSREEKPGMIDYNRINETTFDNYQILINCTPLGTFPNVESCPPLPYQFFTEKHIAFDLVYNPAETEFMRRAKQHGATVSNGYAMLVNQAEKAWRIWNK